MKRGMIPAIIAIAILKAATLAAQQAAWVRADDSGLPLFEQLIARGDVRDPSPQVRPFRRGDALAVLRVADCGTSAWCTATVAALQSAWTDPAGRRSASVAARAGAQSETAARGDPLWPAGIGKGLEGLATVDAAAATGVAMAQARMTWDPRATRDPDRGTATFDDVRLADAVVGVVLPFASATAGWLSRDWGPADAEGTARSQSGYPEPSFAVDLGGRCLHVSLVAARLDNGVTADGAPVQRWFGMHRLDLRPREGLAFALWETAVAQGERRNGDDALYGLLGTLAFDQAFGRRQQRNSMIGADFTWQPHRLRVEGQFALDDWRSLAPPRYAFVAAVGGPLGARMSWRVTWARVSNLAYRTSDPNEDFLFNGVSLGPIIPDHDLIRLVVGVPVSNRLILRPGLAALVQGEGRITSAFPPFDSLPTAVGFLEGTVRHTVRASLRADGRLGPLYLSGDAGVNFDRNASHVPGVSRTHFEGRVAVSVGASRTWSGP